LVSTILSQKNIITTGRYIFIGSLILSGAYVLSEVLFFLLIDYPFNLYEPETAIEAWQLSEGGKIYNDPANGPPAGLYAPLFQLTGALLFQFLPDTLITLRLISLFSVAGIIWLIRQLCPIRSGIQLLFIIVLIGMWHPVVVFFDFQAKPDSFASLWMFTSIFSLLLWMNRDRTYLGWLTALSLTFAFYTKQTMVFTLAACLIALLLHKEFRKTVILTALTLGLYIVSWFLLKLTTGPALFFYLFELPGSFHISYGRLADTFYKLISEPWFLLTLYLAGRNRLKPRWVFRDTVFFIVIVFALFSGILTAAKDGGQSNAFIPFYWLCSAYIAIQLSTVTTAVTREWLKINKSRGLLTLLYLLPVLVISTIQLNPAQYISRIQNRLNASKNYEHLSQQLGNVQGTLFVPYDNYLSLKAGKPYFWSYKSERDLFYTRQKPHPGYRQHAVEFEHVVTVHIGHYYQPESFESILKEHNYSYFKSFKMDEAITYKWWKKNN